MSSDGALVLVVGPSGVGKDSLLRAARSAFADDTRIRIARRYITRAPDPNEDNLSLGPVEFHKARELGGFLLSWDAHGLNYGVPASLAIDLVCGVSVVANVSRTIVEAARKAWPRTFVVLVTARQETLARRLRERGRDADGAGRLARAIMRDDLAPDLTIANDGDLDEAATQLIAFLERVSARPALAVNLAR